MTEKKRHYFDSFYHKMNQTRFLKNFTYYMFDKKIFEYFLHVNTIYFFTRLNLTMNQLHNLKIQLKEFLLIENELVGI